VECPQLSVVVVVRAMEDYRNGEGQSATIAVRDNRRTENQKTTREWRTELYFMLSGPADPALPVD
jgi:hypothetical protein